VNEHGNELTEGVVVIFFAKKLYQHPPLIHLREKDAARTGRGVRPQFDVPPKMDFCIKKAFLISYQAFFSTLM